MTQLILHHYPTSPFAEKVRLILGFKGLDWLGVDIPRIMPKPDVIALTGGYRKTPILQIGADVYCDSSLIAVVIVAEHASPGLYPGKFSAAARTLAQWADSTLFWTAIPYALQPAGLAHMFAGMPQEEIKAFGDDRATFRASVPRMRGADAEGALRIYLSRLSDILAGDPFLFGATPSIADFSVYHCLWFVRRAGPMAKIFEEYPTLAEFLARMQAFGHGRMQPLSSTDAIATARASTPQPSSGLSGDTHGFKLGERVVINATDTGTEPVEGELYALGPDRIAVMREDARAGRVVVHFPRLGFEWKRPR